MKSRKPLRKNMIASCDQLGPDDGLDPRFDDRGLPGRRPGRKSLQLCREVQRTLDAVLTGECDDDVLRDLVVTSVVPAGGGRLLVRVALAPSGQPRPAEEVMARLHAVAGRLRSEVAVAVNRRKAPDLVFEVART